MKQIRNMNGRTLPFSSTVTSGFVDSVPIWGIPARFTSGAVAMFAPLEAEPRIAMTLSWSMSRRTAFTASSGRDL